MDEGRGRAAAGLLCLPLLLACRGGASDTLKEAPLPVRSSIVELGPFQASVLLLGVLRPARSVIVRTPAAGVIEYPAASQGHLTLGGTVKAGEVLATILNPTVDLGLTEAQLAVDSANSDVERQERSFAQGLSPRVDLEKAKQAQSLAVARLKHAASQSTRLLVKAPIAGRLLVASPLPAGAQVQDDMQLAEILGDASLQVEARAARQELAQVHPGLRGQLRTAEGEELGSATVTEISPLLDGAGSVRVLARVESLGRGPIAGEGVQLEVALDRRQAITLPEESLVMTASGLAVFVLDTTAYPRRVHLQPVSAGGRAAGRIEIVRGLQPGQRVIEQGTAALTDGAAVSEEIAAPAPGGARPRRSA